MKKVLWSLLFVFVFIAVTTGGYFALGLFSKDSMRIQTASTVTAALVSALAALFAWLAAQASKESASKSATTASTLADLAPNYSRVAAATHAIEEDLLNVSIKKLHADLEQLRAEATHAQDATHLDDELRIKIDAVEHTLRNYYTRLREVRMAKSRNHVTHEEMSAEDWQF